MIARELRCIWIRCAVLSILIQDAASCHSATQVGEDVTSQTTLHTGGANELAGGTGPAFESTKAPTSLQAEKWTIIPWVEFDRRRARCTRDDISPYLVAAVHARGLRPLRYEPRKSEKYELRAFVGYKKGQWMVRIAQEGGHITHVRLVEVRNADRDISDCAGHSRIWPYPLVACEIELEDTESVGRMLALARSKVRDIGFMPADFALAHGGIVINWQLLDGNEYFEARSNAFCDDTLRRLLEPYGGPYGRYLGRQKLPGLLADYLDKQTIRVGGECKPDPLVLTSRRDAE